MIEKTSSVHQAFISEFLFESVSIEQFESDVPLDDVEKLVFIYFEEHRRMRTSTVNFLFCSSAAGPQLDHLI
jgi:hypothetical protein